MTEHDIGRPGDPFFRLGAWSDDPPPAAGPFPLITLSHGTGGSAQIMAWLARALASRGYIVAGVDHPGNNAMEEYTAEGFLLWWERARDLTTVIDMLFRDRQFGRLIDRNRIGAAGFSLGGYTVIEIAGGRTDPAGFGNSVAPRKRKDVWIPRNFQICPRAGLNSRRGTRHSDAPSVSPEVRIVTLGFGRCSLSHRRWGRHSSRRVFGG
jgi:Platelet-activating factor acetylhydrolase, isoform II